MNILTTISKFKYVLTQLLKVKNLKPFIDPTKTVKYGLNCSLSFRKFCPFLHLHSPVGFQPQYSNTNDHDSPFQLLS